MLKCFKCSHEIILLKIIVHALTLKKYKKNYIFQPTYERKFLSETEIIYLLEICRIGTLKIVFFYKFFYFHSRLTDEVLIDNSKAEKNFLWPEYAC